MMEMLLKETGLLEAKAEELEEALVESDDEKNKRELAKQVAQAPLPLKITVTTADNVNCSFGK